jgi:hypothetical protein
MLIRAGSAQHRPSWQGTATQVGWLACIAAPWLSPRASGPSASVDQWVLTGLSVAGMLALSGLAASFTSEGQRSQARGAIMTGWLVAALLSTVIALCQYFGVAELFPAIMSSTSTNEPFANLRQRNQFASLTVIGMAVLLWLSTQGLSRTAGIAAMAFLAAGNAATASRAGVLEMLVILVAAWMWRGPYRAALGQLSAAGIGAYVVASLALPLLGEMVPQSLAYGVLGRFGRDEGCASRVVLWSNVLHLIAQKPWTGWGWGNLDFAHYMTLYPGPRFCDVLDNAHNLPLQLGVELGIPMSVFVCAVAGWFVWRHAPWRENRPARRAAWWILIVIAIHSMVEYPLWYGPFLVALCLCAGFVAMPPDESPRGQGRRLPVAASWRLASAGVVLAAALFSGWQYQLASQIYLPAEQRLPAYREDTLRKIRDAWLFNDQILFAELTITPLTAANAQWTLEAARQLLHFSPEPRVIEKLIESAMLLKLDDEAAAHMQRYRAAFPKDYARWLRLRS